MTVWATEWPRQLQLHHAMVWWTSATGFLHWVQTSYQPYWLRQM